MVLEIEDRNGTVLYRRWGSRDGERPAGKSGRLTGDILRNVVKWGNKRANGAVKIGDAVVPVAGRLAQPMTSRMRHSYFIPSLSPRAGNGEYDIPGVYVGYDDNRKMVRGNVKVAGSLGALPTWI